MRPVVGVSGFTSPTFSFFQVNGNRAIFFRGSYPSRLDTWCCLVLCWVCLFFALSTALGWEWYDNYSSVVKISGHPRKYYSQSELLNIWSNDSRVSYYCPSSAFSSIIDLYDYFLFDEPSGLKPFCPTLAVDTNYEWGIAVDDVYRVYSNQLCAVGIGGSGGNPFIPDSAIDHYHASPLWFSTLARYSFGFSDGDDTFPPSPAFGNFFSNDFFRSTSFVNDWQTPGPLVWRIMYNVDDYPDFISSRSSFVSYGPLRVVRPYYLFPTLPYLEEEIGYYPVTLDDAYDMLDEYYLPFFWQVRDGVVFWNDSDTWKIRTVLRFSSPQDETD